MYLLFATGFAALILIGDLLIKEYVETHFEIGEERAALDGKVLFRRVHNRGLALNALEGKPKLVKTLSAAAMCFCTGMAAAVMTQKGHWIRKSGYICLLAGAASNLYDRFVREYVVDYIGLKTKWKKVTRITFNLGDVCIFAGILTVLLTFLKSERK